MIMYDSPHRDFRVVYTGCRLDIDIHSHPQHGYEPRLALKGCLLRTYVHGGRAMHTWKKQKILWIDSISSQCMLNPLYV